MLSSSLPSRKLFIVLLFIVFGSVQAEDEFRGRILKVNGDVHIINEKGEMRKLEESRFLVRELDTVVTSENGTAVIRFNDGSMSVMSEKSSLRVEKTNWLSHIGGRIYFTFRKVFGEPKRVRTPFATIGVRGTTFVIFDDEAGQGVSLQEGVVEVESPAEAFEIHRTREMDEFERFRMEAKRERQQMLDEFEDYKKKTIDEFVVYRKQFTLDPGHTIRFDGNRVDESLFDDDDRQQFEDFEIIAGEMLKEFREKAAQHRQEQEGGAETQDATESDSDDEDFDALFD